VTGKEGAYHVHGCVKAAFAEVISADDFFRNVIERAGGRIGATVSTLNLQLPGDS
jgi:hypothetical protein